MNLINLIKQNLTPDIRYKKHSNHPSSGYCYIAAEALFHLLGGKESGCKSFYIKHEGQSHWYITYHGKIIDITAAQFKNKPNYTKGIGKGFLTKRPSKRAEILINRIILN